MRESNGAELLGDVGDFFENYWEQTFLHRSGQVDRVPADLEDVDQLLNDHVLTTSTVVMSSGGRLIDARRFTVDGTPLVRNGMGPQAVVDPDRLLAEFQRGATAVFQRIEDLLPKASAVAQKLTEIVGHPVRGNMFLTPPGAPGFGMHIDGADVFVLQCSGVKRWELWERSVMRPLCEDEWKPTVLPAPDYVVDLHPGDLLYLPRGWRHRVGSCSEVSLSMSYNLRTVTRAHVARAIVERACQTERFRVALHPTSMKDAVACKAEIQTILNDLSEVIDSLDPADLTAAVDELVHQVRQPKPSISVADAIASIGLTDNHHLRIAHGVDVVVADNALHRGDQRISPPKQFVSAFARTGDEAVSVQDIRGVLPLEAAGPLLLKLLADGWIRAA